jgi:hypothetical protein
MLHPALAQALATAHIEDLQRAAAHRRAIRAARRVAHEAHMSATSNAPASAPRRGLRARDPRHDTSHDSASSRVVMPFGPRSPLRAESQDRSGIK